MSLAGCFILLIPFTIAVFGGTIPLLTTAYTARDITRLIPGISGKVILRGEKQRIAVFRTNQII